MGTVRITEKNKTKKKGVRQFLSSSSYQYKLPQTHTYIPKFQFPIMPYLNTVLRKIIRVRHYI